MINHAASVWSILESFEHFLQESEIDVQIEIDYFLCGQNHILFHWWTFSRFWRLRKILLFGSITVRWIGTQTKNLQIVSEVSIDRILDSLWQGALSITRLIFDGSGSYSVKFAIAYSVSITKVSKNFRCYWSVDAFQFIWIQEAEKKVRESITLWLVYH